MNIEKVIRQNIDRTVHMSLATCADQKPWITELHFAYDPDLNLYFRSLKSRRHSQEIGSNPRVAGNIIDKFPLGQPALGIYFEGVVKMLTTDQEIDDSFEFFEDKLQASQDILDEAKTEDGHKIYKITINTWYVFGGLDGNPPHKYKLDWNGTRD